MKANQASLSNDRAEVGVGTLIVFIAMVLVAAVAAAVLINTSGSLQQRASATGKDATQEVSSNMMVEGVYGVRSNAGGSLSSTIDNVTINLGLQAGAVPIDLNQLRIRWSDGTSVREMNYTQQTASVVWTDDSNDFFESRFRLDALRDDDGSFTATSPVVTSGDLVKLTIYRVNLAVRTPIQVSLFPEAGAQVPADFTTPPTYGTGMHLVLR
ncbi:MAG TPA: archaellin/type IV pilin N-terminal domain-containing protein [Candidatus Thermoplasmatota archaeon]|nr:archaellin/type IV pilin N-terminal domain-containing protein [Candidatus Thermoplasmatota archaeon]